MFTISGRVFGFLSTLSLRRATATLGAKKYCYRISIHALLAESDLCHHISKNAAIGFLSTLSLRRATVHSVNTQVSTVDFYPRSPCGERLYVLAFALRLHPFLSTLSLRRATQHQQKRAYVDGYFYPRSPCGERLKTAITAAPQQEFLSTLSLRRATTGHGSQGGAGHRFLSTLSLRRATMPASWIFATPTNFYPRSPCGERPHRSALCGCLPLISIHALLAESDLLKL